MIRRFTKSANYVRMRAALGVLYALLGVLILVRTCMPLSSLSWAKISPLALGAAVAGLGIVRIREFVMMRKDASP